jgi:hypothetical protein
VVGLARTKARLGAAGFARTNPRPLGRGQHQRGQELTSQRGEGPPPPATARALPGGIHRRRRGRIWRRGWLGGAGLHYLLCRGVG